MRRGRGRQRFAFTNNLRIYIAATDSRLISPATGNRHSTRKRIEQERM
jgi:hypothetical protein